MHTEIRKYHGLVNELTEINRGIWRLKNPRNRLDLHKLHDAAYELLREANQILVNASRRNSPSIKYKEKIDQAEQAIRHTSQYLMLAQLQNPVDNNTSFS